MILRSVDALKTFDIIYAMTGGGPGYASETLNIMGFKYSFEYFRLGQASVILVFLFLVVLAVSLGIVRAARPDGVVEGAVVKTRLLPRVVLWVCIVLICLVVIFPFLWILSSSFKRQVDIIATPPRIFVFAPTLANYVRVFAEQNFLRFFVNSTRRGDHRRRAVAPPRSSGRLQHRALQAGAALPLHPGGPPPARASPS